MKRGLSSFTARVDIGFDFGYADIYFCAARALYEHGRRLLDVVFVHKVQPFLGEHLGVGNSGFLQHSGCHFAVRTRFRRHKRDSGSAHALMFQPGMTDVIEEALWQLNNNFELYWGKACASVLRAIHLAIYRIVDTDDSM